MSDPVVVFAIVEVPDTDFARVSSAVQDLARQSRQEAGSARYEVYRSKKTPATLIIHEIWDSDEALQAHRSSRHVEAFKAALRETAATVWASPCVLIGGAEGAA